MTLGALTAHHHTRVIGGRRHHTEHFARRGLDGYDAAYLAFHQPLAQLLQLYVDAQREVFACLRTTVELSVLIVSLHAPMRITKQDLYPLHAAQLPLIAALDAQLADIVARLIIVVGLNIGWRHLADIA